MTNYKRLYKKYLDEQQKFEEWLKEQPWIIARRYAFDLALQDDILFAISEQLIDSDDIDTLLSNDVPLEGIVRSGAVEGIEFMAMIADIVGAVAFSANRNK
jgi:hypothetical protein